MSAEAFASGSSWSWPDESISVTGEGEARLPGSFKSDEWVTEVEDDFKREEAPKQGAPKKESNVHQTPPKSKRYYPPRTCRICLEIVNPTFETVTDGFSGMLSPSPRVQYISQEPESGRLIRPCKCKGSQRYVHEGCLQDWRHADPGYARRNYWECPTCKFKYRLERMRWSRWISSTLTQVSLTVLILLITIFLLGFVADPIINLYFDPIGTLTTNPFAPNLDLFIPESEDEAPLTWVEHFLKGLASLGLLGFIKVIFARSPWQWYNLRNSGLLGGGGRNGRAGTGRDRMEGISWWLVMIGVSTFLYAVWKGVRAWSRTALEKAGERVADVQGEDDDGVEDDIYTENRARTDPEASNAS